MYDQMLTTITPHMKAEELCKFKIELKRLHSMAKEID